ncbi:MAG: hypothetical protein EU539_08445 [Promethearchaeota archaeon]|nr:MAG: hypothetical protein EU539_08445 [Candidatus Lokiarchaeota archaeon]
MLRSKIKLKDFNTIQKNLNRVFQKFIDTKDLINYDKGTCFFTKINENSLISPFKILFNEPFRSKLNLDRFNDKCDELKESLDDFKRFEDIYGKLHHKLHYLEMLREKFINYQKILHSGNLKKINEENIEDFRLFRSLIPLKDYHEYVIDIINRNVIKL